MENQKTICNKLEYQIKDVDSGTGVVEIYVNAFNNKDTDDDISLPGSFAKTIAENRKRIRHFLNHRTDKLIGIPLEMREDTVGLLVTSKLNLKVQDGRDTFEHYKLFAENNLSLEHSVGVKAVKYEIDEVEGVRKVSEWKLWEYSTLHAWGANELALTQDVKSKLETILNKGQFTDSYLKQIELKLNEIKALVAEPLKKHSDKNEPHDFQNEVLDMLNETIKLF
jgi:HK97 family phage prohead protease